MKSRRSFLKKGLLGSLALGGSWPGLDQFSEEEEGAPEPLVIATWNNLDATEAAWKEIEMGRRALDAVEAGAKVPEANPKDVSVGYGGRPDREGIVTLDACIMDEEGQAGSVSFLQGIKHPISVARLVMEKTPHVMLVGEGAKLFALEEGFKEENLLTESTKKAYEKWKETSKYEPQINSELHDTIGILAIDKKQRISGACTTSGMGYKMHGRVGDSPVIGAGLYSDPKVGAAAATGLGELVLKSLSSFQLVEYMRKGKHPAKAAELAIRHIIEKYPEQSKKSQVGLIAVDRKGRVGAYAIQPGFIYSLYYKGENKVFKSASYYSRKG